MMASRRVLGGLLRGIVRGLRDPAFGRADEDEQRAWAIAMSVCDEMHPFGPVVLPARPAAEAMIERDERDEAIWREFDGRNYEEIAVRHNLTVRYVRRIVERERRKLTRS